jgi:hypothetical protein
MDILDFRSFVAFFLVVRGLFLTVYFFAGFWLCRRNVGTYFYVIVEWGKKEYVQLPAEKNGHP